MGQFKASRNEIVTETVKSHAQDGTSFVLTLYSPGFFFPDGGDTAAGEK